MMRYVLAGASSRALNMYGRPVVERYGVAANRSIASGQPVTISDLL